MNSIEIFLIILLIIFLIIIFAGVGIYYLDKTSVDNQSRPGLYETNIMDGHEIVIVINMYAIPGNYSVNGNPCKFFPNGAMSIDTNKKLITMSTHSSRVTVPILSISNDSLTYNIGSKTVELILNRNNIYYKDVNKLLKRVPIIRCTK